MYSRTKTSAMATSIKQTSLSFAIVVERTVSSRIFLWLTFIWFIFQATWMALSTNPGISPDENYHFHLIKLFANNGWLPFIHNQYGVYSLGEVVHTPFFLYHYLLSLPFHLFGGSSHAVEILRLFNVALGAISFYLIIKLASGLKVSPLVRNLSLFMLTNTLMYVFLTGSINYDNLLIPLALLCFILTIRLFHKIDISSLLILLITLLAGTLTVLNFLPIAFVVVVTVIFQLLKHSKGLGERLVSGWRSRRALNISLLIVLIPLAVLFSQRYLVNMAKYHTYQPSCDRVNTTSQCMQNGIYVRAIKMQSQNHSIHVSPLGYLASWIGDMGNGTFGIFGHRLISPNKIIRIWSMLLMFAGFLVIFKYYKNESRWNILVIFCLFNISILFTRNYFGYAHNGLDFGVQGRYIFPFLPFIYILLNRYVLEFLLIQYKRLRATYVALTILVFATASLPTYLLKTTPDWYTNQAAQINLSLHNKLKKIL